jgi:hypothetical protein
VDILVKHGYSDTDIKRAKLKAALFDPKGSAASVVLDYADLGKAITLCETHHRKFDARKYGYYRQKDYPFVMANCDGCKLFCQCQLFIHESVLKDVWRTREQQRRDREYATIV